MKKLLCLITISLFLLTIVFAQRKIGGETDEHGCLNMAGFTWNEEIGECEREWSGEIQNRQETRLEIQSKVTGLENAILRVRNEETKQHLQQVMEKIQTQQRERLNRLEDLEIIEEEDEITAIGKKEAKLFGLFKLKHMYRYEIQENGNVIRQKRMFDWLWRDIEEVG